MFQTVTHHIDKAYEGNAVIENYDLNPDKDVYGTFNNIDLLVLIPACYILPFIIALIVLVIVLPVTCRVLYKKDNFKTNLYEKTIKPLMSEVRLQANTTAVVVVCSLVTLSISTLDLVSVIVELTADLPHYSSHSVVVCLHFITIFCSIISFIFLIYGIFIFVYLGWRWKKLENPSNDSINRNLSLLIPIAFCVGSTVLSLSFHIQSILIAWATDPVYASKIFIYNVLFFFTLFLSCKYAYSVPITLRQMVSDEPRHSEVWYVGITMTAAVANIVIIHTAAVCFYSHVPVNNAVEGSVSGISSIYNSAVLLIGGLIAYNVGWYYFRTSFSFEDAIRKAMKNVTKQNHANWNQFTEEERLINTIETVFSIIQHEATRVASQASGPVAGPAGEPGCVPAGEPGVAQAGEPGVAEAGEPGGAPAGEPGGVPAGEPGVAQAGEPGVAQVGEPGSVPTGEPGGVQAGEPGVAQAGELGVAPVGGPDTEEKDCKIV